MMRVLHVYRGGRFASRRGELHADAEVSVRVVAAIGVDQTEVLLRLVRRRRGWGRGDRVARRERARRALPESEDVPTPTGKSCSRIILRSLAANERSDVMAE